MKPRGSGGRPKKPTPASVRLGRAQAKLDRAIAIQAESRQAILDHEKAYKDRLAVLQSRMDEDTARVRTRRQQLEAVQAELGADAGGGRVSAEQGAAVKQVHGSLCNDVAPAQAALVEQLDTSTPAWATLNRVLSTLSSSKALLEQAIAPRGAQAYDIGDAADEDYGDDHEGWDGSDWSESHDLQDKGAQVVGGQGNVGGSSYDDHDQCMGSGYWWDSPHEQWQQAVRWEPCGHGKWARSSWADSWEREYGTGTAGDEAPAAARRRLDPQANTPPEGGEGDAPPAATDEAADAARRKQQHDARVARIIQRAIDAGVQPITSAGEELQLLDPHRLDEWVAEKLPGEPFW